MSTDLSQSEYQECRTAREAFYFDSEELRSSSLLDLLKKYHYETRYNALVNIRLQRYFYGQWQFFRSRLRDVIKERRMRFLLLRHPMLFLRAFRCRIVYKLYGIAYRYTGNALMVKHACNISAHAIIGRNFWGIFRNIQITANAVIGKNAYFEANVSIAAVYDPLDRLEKASTSRQTAGYPVIGDNVVIHTGAVVVGNVHIGDNAVIGANSLVLSSVPADSTVLGVPARVVFKRKKDQES